jgi:hypothetical protein
MGNDKKNRSIFHDTKNIKTCCVEIADNQNMKYWMTDPNVTADDFVLADGDDGFYEFRYGADKYKGSDPVPNGMTGKEYRNTVQVQAFLDLVKWMCSCDPSPLSLDHPCGYKNSYIL